jgi:hypothetical protein
VETAELVATELGLPVSSVVKETDLRERYFGTALELQSHDLYAGVWEVDMQDVSQGPAGGGVRGLLVPLFSLMADYHAASLNASGFACFAALGERKGCLY